jgi:hypothetical protein
VTLSLSPSLSASLPLSLTLSLYLSLCLSLLLFSPSLSPPLSLSHFLSGLCSKEKIFKGYVELEMQLGEIDRCRSIYGYGYHTATPHSVAKAMKITITGFYHDLTAFSPLFSLAAYNSS